MQAAVTSETTELTVTVEVSDVPDIDITERWHTRPRSFRPEALVIRATNGEFASVEVRGGQVKMNGEASENVIAKRSWHAENKWSAQATWVSAAPDWVQMIVADVLHPEEKITSWSAP